MRNETERFRAVTIIHFGLFSFITIIERRVPGDSGQCRRPDAETTV